MTVSACLKSVSALECVDDPLPTDTKSPLASEPELTATIDKFSLMAKPKKPKPPTIATLLLGPLSMGGCAINANLVIPCAGAEKDIAVSAPRSNQDCFEQVLQLISEDLALLNEVNDTWLCMLDQIHFEVIPDEEYTANGKGGSYQSSEDYDEQIELIFPQSWIDDLNFSDINSDSYESARLHCRFTLFHEFGHMVSNWAYSSTDIEEFAGFSFDYNPDCDVDEDIEGEIASLATCWDVSADSQESDFMAYTFAKQDEGDLLAYGSTSAAEDWANTFAMAADSLLYEWGITPFNIVEEYSELGWAKLDWMQNLLNPDQLPPS